MTSDMHSRALLILLVTACGPLPGDRAGGGGGGTGGGGCPATEDCSPETPDGLFFEGRTLGNEVFGGRGDHPTAVGGEQTYRIYINAERAPLQLAYTAEIDAADLAVAEITGVAGNRVTVRGLEPGYYSLRILDSDGALMDRITLDTGVVAAAALGPTFADLLGDSEGTTDAQNPPLYFEGGEVDLVASVEDEFGNYLVDENLEIEGLTSGSSWDVFPSVTIGPEPLAITAASSSYPFALPTTDTIDAVIPTQPEQVSPIEMGVDSREIVCFRAVSDSRAVLGAAWSYAVTADALVTAAGFSRNCVELVSGGPETASLTAAAELVTATFDVVVSAALAPQDHQPVSRPQAVMAPMAGDRAAR